ncbi:MAG TPA: SRPBCC family protein [Gaiellaceae bacterium]|nr:SRPBCC family protein [Gaiellaceae bacterium]
MRTIEATARTPAARDAVWRLVADASRWSDWGSWSRVEVEGGGEQREGAIRVLERGRYRVRETITEWVPGERTSYELLEGMNVQGYRSTLSLEDAPEGGTTVRWRSTYERAGLFTALVLRLAVRDACRRLARAAA